MEVAGARVWFDAGHRHRIFTQRDRDAYAGMFWTVQTATEFLQRRRFQVTAVENYAVEQAAAR
jgi:hypothetical protein